MLQDVMVGLSELFEVVEYIRFVHRVSVHGYVHRGNI
jgi:hypothetical protein